MSKRIRIVLLSVVCALLLSITSCGERGVAVRAVDGVLGGYQWTLRMQLVKGAGTTEFRIMQEMAENLLVASGGRLNLEVHPLGTFASSMELFPAAIHGVVDIAANYGTWLRAIDNGLHVITTGNMQMDPIAKRIWLNEFGGYGYAEYLFDKAGLVFLAFHTDGTEVLHTHQRFDTVRDMAGSIFRSSDPRLVNQFGITGITVPLEEIFTTFQTGAVDIVEYGHLDINTALGFTELGNYASWPDFWNVHNSIAIVMNRDSYNSLPEDLRALLRMAFRGSDMRHFTATQFASAQTMQRLQAAGTVYFYRFGYPEEFAEMARIQRNIVNAADIATHGGMTAHLYQSQDDFMRIWLPYREISRWWGEGLTFEQVMGF